MHRHPWNGVFYFAIVDLMGAFTETVNLDPGEQIVGIFRAHTFSAVRHLALPSVALCMLFLFLFPFFRLGLAGVGIFLVLATLDLVFLLRQAFAWYGTLYILTSRRLFGIRRTGFFKNKPKRFYLKISASSRVKRMGHFRFFFRFGDVALTLYTSSHSFTLHDVSDPNEVLTSISGQISRVKKPIHTDDDTELLTSENNLKKGRVHKATLKKRV